MTPLRAPKLRDWALWLLLLTACPAAMIAVTAACELDKPYWSSSPQDDPPLPYAAKVVNALGVLQLAAALIAGGTGFRWADKEWKSAAAVALIIASVLFTAAAWFVAAMATTGEYL